MIRHIFILMLPIIVFIFSVFLYLLKLPFFYEDLKYEVKVIYSFFVFFYLLGVFSVLIVKKISKKKADYSKFYFQALDVERVFVMFFLLGVLLFFIEWIYFGFYSLPILSNQSSEAYIGYGLPVIHNYVVLMILSSHFFFYRYLVSGRKKYLLLLLIITIILFSNLSKGIMILQIFPMISISFAIVKRKIRILLVLLVVLPLVLFVPNLIREGDVASVVIHKWNYISGFESQSFIFQLVYMYSTSMHHVFNQEVGDVLQWGNFSNLINPLLSLSFMKFFLGEVEPLYKYSGDYYNGSWNVVGGVGKLYQDFGVISVMLYSYIYGLLLSFFYITRNQSIFSFIVFVNIYTAALLLFFSDFLKAPIFLFLMVGIVMAKLFKRSVRL